MFSIGEHKLYFYEWEFTNAVNERYTVKSLIKAIRVVSAEELAPGFCAYDCWLPYQTYDVTAQLRPGENILGAWLGNGYYKGRVSWPGMQERRCIYGDENALIAELAVELENGETLLIPTDEPPLPYNQRNPIRN